MLHCARNLIEGHFLCTTMTLSEYIGIRYIDNENGHTKVNLFMFPGGVTEGRHKARVLRGSRIVRVIPRMADFSATNLLWILVLMSGCHIER